MQLRLGHPEEFVLTMGGVRVILVSLLRCSITSGFGWAGRFPFVQWLLLETRERTESNTVNVDGAIEPSPENGSSIPRENQKNIFNPSPFENCTQTGRTFPPYRPGLLRLEFS